jgi:hypothetical protein
MATLRLRKLFLTRSLGCQDCRYGTIYRPATAAAFAGHGSAYATHTPARCPSALRAWAARSHFCACDRWSGQHLNSLATEDRADLLLHHEPVGFIECPDHGKSVARGTGEEQQRQCNALAVVAFSPIGVV